MLRHLKNLRRGHLVGLVALVVCATGAAGQVREPQLASAQARELWLKGSDQILAGDFASALPTLEQLQRIEPGHEEIVSAITWMRKAQELAASREELRKETYEYFVSRVQKHVREAKEAALNPPMTDASAKRKPAEKKDPSAEEDASGDDEEEEEGAGYKWSKALRDSLNAMYNAKSEDAFRKEPWLKEIIDNVLIEIDRHKQKNEWADALALYSYLQTLYPKEKQYEEGFKFCAKRAHLDFVYGPKGEWRRQLREVTPDAIPQILERLEDDYVEDVDLKRLCIEGIEHLRLLAEAESISEAFPTLAEEDRVSHFVRRLEGLKQTRVDGKPALRARDVENVFERILVANAESGLKLPESVLVDEFVSGMLEPLDEFTSVIWPAEVEEFNKHTRGEFVGVGIQITQGDGKYIRVETPLEDSPAYKAGIKPGDLIMAVDGKSTLDMTINQAVSEITGEPGTKVTLTIKDGLTEKVTDYVLTREQIKLKTVRGNQRDDSNPTGWDFMIDPASRVGYIRVSGFMDKTVEELQAALEQLQDQGCRGLILDLRFNPGGLLTSAVKMSELFLDHDEPIVKTKGRSRQQNMEIAAKTGRRFAAVPMIVLVNEYSASASEIVAGAVSGLKEACIIGTRTFGKGSVQNLIPIADNRAYLKLTTAYYYVYDADLPEDPWYCLHRKPQAESWGVEPHIEVKVIPSEQNKILRLRRERDLLKGKDGAAIPKEVLERRTTSQPEDELPEDPNPDVDPQLESALNIMRIKLLSNQPWAMPPREMRAISRSDTVMKESASR
ncbi:MAG: hypothetical protein DCC65_02480 [Planctomycetota bacterium]|nr:MAG: hypothetical protein DCC65_02480 [Planctomycetota bacterium]